MRPFFSYYGAKWNLSGFLPPPRYGHIIEAFAGSACYATRYPDCRVTLCEASPVISALWRYLIRTPAAEILALPDLIEDGDLRSLKLVEEARTLIGLRVGLCDTGPRNRWSPFGWKYHERRWSPRIRGIIATMVEKIRHWTVFEGDYKNLQDERATWIIDPPYQGRAGARYPHSRIDYAHLGGWVRSREGLIVLHEGSDATWFPELRDVYEGVGSLRNKTRKWKERIFVKDTVHNEDLTETVIAPLAGAQLWGNVVVRPQTHADDDAPRRSRRAPR